MTTPPEFSSTDAPSPGISIENVHDERAVDHAELEQTVTAVLEEENADLHYLGIILAGHETVLELNRRYLDHDYTTDVLSFPLREPSAGGPVVVDGEIYVDLDTAAERAPEFETTFETEVRRYVIHGLLHLLGYNDKTEADQEAMRVREERYL